MEAVEVLGKSKWSLDLTGFVFCLCNLRLASVDNGKGYLLEGSLIWIWQKLGLRYKPHTFPPFQQYTQTAEGALFSNMRNSPQISAPTSRSFYLVSYHVYSTYNNAHLAIIQSLLYQFKLQLSNKNRHYAHAVDSVIVARSTARLLPPSKELFPCHCHIMIFSRES